MKTIHAKRPAFPCRAALALAVLSITACSILNEKEYNFERLGPTALLYDDFEQNDGTMSTRYNYTLQESENQPGSGVTDDYAFDGRYSIELYQGASLEFSVEPDEQALLSFYSSYENPQDDIHFTLTGNDVPLELYDTKLCYSYGADGESYPWTNSTWWRHSYRISAGRTKIILHVLPGAYSVVFDGLSLEAIASLAFSPGDGESLDAVPLRLDWADEAGAFNYVLQFDQSACFSTPSQSIVDITQSFYDWSPEPGLTYTYWRVGHETSGSFEGILWSEPRKLYFTSSFAEGFSATDHEAWKANNASLEFDIGFNKELLIRGTDGSIQRRLSFTRSGVLVVVVRSKYDIRSTVSFLCDDLQLGARVFTSAQERQQFCGLVSAGTHDIGFHVNGTILMEPLTFFGTLLTTFTKGFEDNEAEVPLFETLGYVEPTGVDKHTGDECASLRETYVSPTTERVSASVFVDSTSGGTFGIWFKGEGDNSLDLRIDDVSITTSTGLAYTWNYLSIPVQAGAHKISIVKLSATYQTHMYIDDLSFTPNP